MDFWKGTVGSFWTGFKDPTSHRFVDNFCTPLVTRAQPTTGLGEGASWTVAIGVERSCMHAKVGVMSCGVCCEVERPYEVGVPVVERAGTRGAIGYVGGSMEPQKYPILMKSPHMSNCPKH